MVEGFNWREEQEAIKLRWMAWHSAMLPYLKDPPGLKEFMDSKPQQADNRQSWQEIKAMMKAFSKRMNQGRG